MIEFMQNKPSGIALSIRQPWAWLIMHAGKDIENRSWPTRYRGRVLIHASKGMAQVDYDNAAFTLNSIDRLTLLPAKHELQRGGIVGEALIVDCVEDSRSPWFCGRYGFVLSNPKPLPFYPLKGQLGFFKVNQ